MNREQTVAGFQIIDVDTVPELVKTFKVQAVPTFILFNEGIEVNRMTGGKTREQLEDFING